MYVVLVYDIGEKRVSKVLKLARKYLNWMQNSVLEGELTKATFEKFKMELKRVIREEEDSIIFYILPTRKYLKTEKIGKEKGVEELFL